MLGKIIHICMEHMAWNQVVGRSSQTNGVHFVHPITGANPTLTNMSLPTAPLTTMTTTH